MWVQSYYINLHFIISVLLIFADYLFLERVSEKCNIKERKENNGGQFFTVIWIRNEFHYYFNIFTNKENKHVSKIPLTTNVFWPRKIKYTWNKSIHSVSLGFFLKSTHSFLFFSLLFHYLNTKSLAMLDMSSKSFQVVWGSFKKR